ncbi:MAG: DMT family transporter [Pseudomonadota bacterium]
MTDRRFLPYLLLTLTVLFWSGNFVLGRGIRELIPPVSLNFWRWAGALTILLPIGLPRLWRQWPLVRRHWAFLVFMSIPSIAIFNAFIYKALQTASTTNTVLVNAMIPIFIVVMAWAGFGERLTLRQMMGVLISLTGLAFIITRGHLTMLLALQFSSGDLWTLGAGVSWALYSVMLRRRPPEMDPIVFLTAIVMAGLVVLLPFYLWEVVRAGSFPIDWRASASLTYVAVFPSVLAYIFYNRGVAMIGAAKAGIFFHLMPVFSILLAFGLLGERLAGFHLVGMALIFTGIAMTTINGLRGPQALPPAPSGS